MNRKFIYSDEITDTYETNLGIITNINLDNAFSSKQIRLSLHKIRKLFKKEIRNGRN